MATFINNILKRNIRKANGREEGEKRKRLKEGQRSTARRIAERQDDLDNTVTFLIEENNDCPVF